MALIIFGITNIRTNRKTVLKTWCSKTQIQERNGHAKAEESGPNQTGHAKYERTRNPPECTEMEGWEYTTIEEVSDIDGDEDENGANREIEEYNAEPTTPYKQRLRGQVNTRIDEFFDTADPPAYDVSFNTSTRRTPDEVLNRFL